MDDKIKKLEQMIATNDPATMDYLAEIVADATSPEDRARLDELATQLMTGANECLDRVENAVNEQLLREQLGPLAEALNMSYIARTYFGKSRSWLSQRMNGHTVHGRKATLTEDERQTLNEALNDIQSQITAFTHIA
ncbi:MAG: DUF5053 domain-containing protein [Muribaculaceae bacterium]|nr:DUF5053 domain-containing protein [Muribaculaceae bacterium]